MTDYTIDMGPDPTNLMLIGDTHHDTDWTLDLIDHACDLGVDTFVQIGDFGWWPNRFGTEAFVSEIEPVLAERGKRLFWFDGNHEHHESIEPGMKIGVVQHLPRGFRWQWWGKTWMAVGGGASVDQHLRTPGWDWFPEEVLSMAEAKYCARPGHVDIILSHDCPDRVPDLDKRLSPGRYPADQIAKSEAHRAVIGGIVDAVDANLLVHGHYHTSYRGYRLRPACPGTGIIGLANNEHSFDDASLILTEKSFARSPEVAAT